MIKRGEEIAEGKKPKYAVKPPRDLTSKFLAKEKQKEKDKMAVEEAKRREEEAARLAVSSGHCLICLFLVMVALLVGA